MNTLTKHKIVEWFIKDISETVSWSDVDVSEEYILEIAMEKTESIIEILEGDVALTPDEICWRCKKIKKLKRLGVLK